MNSLEYQEIGWGEQLTGVGELGGPQRPALPVAELFAFVERPAQTVAHQFAQSLGRTSCSWTNETKKKTIKIVKRSASSTTVGLSLADHKSQRSMEMSTLKMILGD